MQQDAASRSDTQYGFELPERGRGTTIAFLGCLAAAIGARADDLSGCIARKVTFDGVVLLRYATVTPKSGPRDYLHREYPSHCGSQPGTSCRAKAYIVPADAVAIGKTCGAWSYVQLIGERHITTGWVFSSTLKQIPSPPLQPAPVQRAGAEVIQLTPRRYQFKLTRGRGRPVCEAYLQRLNQTEFYRPPYCGRPESDVVPGFGLLHREWMPLKQFKQIYLEALAVLGNQPLTWNYVRHKNPDGSVTLQPPKIYPPFPRNFQPGAWRYKPWVDIENSGVPDNAAMFTDDSRDWSLCGQPFGPKAIPERNGPAGLILSGDGKHVDRQKTYAIFGMQNLSRYGAGVSAEFGKDFGIFEYRGTTYYDTFFDASGGDYAGRRAQQNDLTSLLGVLQFHHGCRQEVCEYYVKDLGDEQ